MSIGMRLSVLGLYKADSGLFSEMVYPATFTDVEKETVVGNILSECAELECLFPDPSTMRTMVGLWSRLNISVWNRIFSASKLEYNPIENYNRTEIETIQDDRTDSHTGTDSTIESKTQTNSGTDSTTENKTQTNSGTDSTTANSTETNSGTDTSTNSITAYDSNTYKPHDKNDLSHGHTVSDNGSSSYIHGHVVADSGSSSITHGEVITHDGDITRENHTTGNIGVTTSQQMLEQEIEVSAKLNVIKMIVDSFKERFCLLVY